MICTQYLHSITIVEIFDNVYTEMIFPWVSLFCTFKNLTNLAKYNNLKKVVVLLSENVERFVVRVCKNYLQGMFPRDPCFMNTTLEEALDTFKIPFLTLKTTNTS